MGSLFASTLNTRFPIEGDCRFLRSDLPVTLTEAEITWLLSHNISTAIDLRTPDEQESLPSCFVNRPEFRLLSMPISGGDSLPATPEEVPISYLNMCDEQIERILDSLLSSDTGVIYFCRAGKDRTGVLSALLLDRLGFDEERIVADYMQSKANLLPMLSELAAKNPAFRLDVITPREENIRAFLRLYHAEKPSQ